MKTVSVLLIASLCLLGTPWRGEAGSPAPIEESAERGLANRLPEEAAGSMVWTPGMPHPTAPNVVASAEKKQWAPAPGYQWLNPGNAHDLRVEALPFGESAPRLASTPRTACRWSRPSSRRPRRRPRA